MAKWTKRMAGGAALALALATLAAAARAEAPQVLTTLAAAARADAPQVLALVAVNNPIDFQCYRGECFAEFSAFCLQPERRSPVEGTVYRLSRADGVHLSGRTRDGRTVRLDAAKLLKFTAQRTHVAVRMSIPAETVHRLGLESLSAAVASDVALLPAPAPGDLPQSVQEMALATGELRQLGSRMVDNDTNSMQVARVTNRMINALPPSGLAGRGARQAAWRKTKAEAAYGQLPAATREQVKAAVHYCNYRSTATGFQTLRQCLSSEHDSTLGRLNNKYWDALKTGS